MKPPKHYDRQTFISLFNSIARHKHRYAVFSDFVTMSAIAYHNAVNKLETLENEYLHIVGKYSKKEVDLFCELLANFIALLDIEPRDVLGSLYMELELGNTNNGQFFTPHDISLLLATLNFGKELENFDKPFLKLSEPTCGAGGMILAFANEMLKKGHNPSQKLWVQAIDIDRVAGFMCYLQLSLWNIPAQVIIGNTLTMDFREIYYTPAHYLYGWQGRLQLRESIERVQKLCQPVEKNTNKEKIVPLVDQEEHDNENKNKNFSLEPEVFENDEIVYENEEAKLYAEASQHVTIPKKKDKTPPKKETSTVQQMDLFDFFVDRDE